MKRTIITTETREIWIIRPGETTEVPAGAATFDPDFDPASDHIGPDTDESTDPYEVTSVAVTDDRHCDARKVNKAAGHTSPQEESCLQPKDY